MPYIVKTLADVALAIPELAKLGQNDEYSYIQANDVVKAFRGKLLERGIVIVPKVLAVTKSLPYQTATGDMLQEVEVSVEYTVTDGYEEIKSVGHGIGQDYKGKALYKALTGSLKYFLMCLGLIAAVEDDPETVNDGPVSESLAEKLDEAEKKFGPDLREHPISQRDVRAWTSICKKAGLSVKAQKHYLHEFFGIEKISDLKRKDSQKAIEWALAKVPADTSLSESAEPESGRPSTEGEE